MTPLVFVLRLVALFAAFCAVAAVRAMAFPALDRWRF